MNPTVPVPSSVPADSVDARFAAASETVFWGCLPTVSGIPKLPECLAE